MFEEASEVFDNMFKGSFPLTFIVFIPAVLILVSPLPIEAAHEFTVYRMQQYDLQGQAYGPKYNLHLYSALNMADFPTQFRRLLLEKVDTEHAVDI
eukprot:g33015.t1